MKFIFLFGPNSDIPEEKFRDIIFEVIVVSKIYKRFDTFHNGILLGQEKRAGDRN